MCNWTIKSLCVVLLAVFFAGCSDDDDNSRGILVENAKKGCFILNSGSFQKNNSNLTFYDNETKLCSDVFKTANSGLDLGDTGQDLLIVDDKLYIAVYESAVIYVTDITGKILKKIESKREGQTQSQSPRSLTTYGNYVYVSYYDGYVARINKNTYEIEKQIKVGNNPEEIEVSKGKLYVANSGGMNSPVYDKTVSVIDLNTFTELKRIDVLDNPTQIEVDNQGSVYVVSMGNYGDIPNTLQRIDPATDKSEVIANATLVRINNDGTKLYTIYAQYGSATNDYKVYDTVAKKMLEGSFVDKDVTFAANPFCFNINPTNGNLYIGTSDYVNTGMMYILSPTTGKVVESFNTKGYNPMGAYFVK